jgi:hypothetical protein
MQHSLHSVLGCSRLADIKARVREIWLDGALTSAFSPHLAAVRFRVLACGVCLRLLQVRNAFLHGGIPVEEAVLAELLRADPGVYPSETDADVARQAIRDAQVTARTTQVGPRGGDVCWDRVIGAFLSGF